MIKKEILEVISVQTIAQDTIEMILKNDYISAHAVPGQFIHISVPGHTLRRPISIAAVERTEKTLTILFKVIGSGTETLADFQVGDYLDVLGPSGNGFPIDNLTKQDSVLLIGGGIGVPPIHFLATELIKHDVNVQAILGFQTKDYVFYESQFHELAETIIVTNDGSYGKKGFVTDYTDQIAPFTQYYACGPMPMLKAVVEVLPEKRGFLSFEERMGCGVGACYACVLPTKTEAGYKKICQDGPVFAANEVSL